MITDISPLVHLLLFAVGVFAGFVDSIAGGGGLIALPALLAAGIPPHQALATNKLQGSFGTFSSTLNYARLGLASPRSMVLGIVFTFIGAAAGAWAVQQFSAGFLGVLILVMMTAIFIYTLMTPRLGFRPGPRRLPRPLFYMAAGLLLGFYDGFFGPGAGSFWTLALVLLLGLGLKEATAETKAFNLTSNLVALAVFIASGLVIWSVGLAMGAGQLLGAWAGSTMVHRRDVSFVRLFFLLVVAATIIKLAWDQFA